MDAAIGFFARFDIRPTEPLSIEVAAKIPAEAGPTASGCFIEAKRRIYVVPYDQFTEVRHFHPFPAPTAAPEPNGIKHLDRSFAFRV